MAGTLQHIYRYPFRSEIAGEPGGPRVQFATSGGAADSPYFFQGALTRPRLTAQLLRVLSKVVAARYHLPPAMLERILRESDPVVTSGGGMLRFEGFSACGSAYARVDLDPDAYVGVVVGQGTTNVDFNAPFRAALAQIRDEERIGLAIGGDEVTLLRGADQHVERKVDLPLRWLKGFVEVQSYQSQMTLWTDLGRIEALRFLRSLPRTTMAKTATWIVPSGSGLRLSQRESADALRVAGLERLRVIEELIPYADRLRIFAHPRGAASEWQMDFGPLRFCLTLSAEVWRGFSGEGQALAALASSIDEALLDRVRRTLHWQSALRIPDFTAAGVADPDLVRRSLAALGSRGLVGYDLSSGAYFHRELPFDFAAIEAMHPRLASARALVDRGAVSILAGAAGAIEAEVTGSGVVHRVRLSPEGDRCTCTWHAKHQGERGPCKHMLAVQLHLENHDAPSHAASES